MEILVITGDSMSAVAKVQLTQEGYNELQEELDALNLKLPAAIERVAKAREHGDLSENSEYHAAREDLAFIQGRIEELEEILGHSTIIQNGNTTKQVALGSKVTVETTEGNQVEFTVVGEYEADPIKKKISHDSPIGKALIGNKVGDKVEFEAPVGKVVYTIKKVQ